MNAQASPTQLSILQIQEIGNLGTGSFAQVKKAVFDDKVVAVKIYNKSNSKNDSKNELELLKEATVLQQASHENIIKIFAYGKWLREDSVEHCIVIEYADVGSLHHVLYNSTLNYTLGHAISWLLQCSDAINYLHSRTPRPTIHRDLKPLNLLLMNGGTLLKICDFGTAGNVKTIMTNDKGSPCWIAPEMLNQDNYNEKCDVFSYSIIAWEVFVRIEPYFHLKLKEEVSSFKLMIGVEKGIYRPLGVSKCPELLRLLFKQGQSGDPEKRPSMNFIYNMMKTLDSMINKEPIKPIVNIETINPRTDSSQAEIKTERFEDSEENKPDNIIIDNAYSNQTSLSAMKTQKNLPFHRRSKSYGNEFIIKNDNALEQIKNELSNRIETMLYQPIEPLYSSNISIEIFNEHRNLIKIDEKLQKDINTLKQQYNQLESTKTNINYYNELLKQKNKLLKENENLKKML